MYVYHLTRDFNLLTRAFIILAFDLPVRVFNLATCTFSLLTCGFELVTRGFELVARRFELIIRGFESVARGLKFVTHGFELVTRISKFVTRKSQLVFYFSTYNAIFKACCFQDLLLKDAMHFIVNFTIYSFPDTSNVSYYKKLSQKNRNLRWNISSPGCFCKYANDKDYEI